MGANASANRDFWGKTLFPFLGFERVGSTCRHDYTLENERMLEPNTMEVWNSDLIFLFNWGVFKGPAINFFRFRKFPQNPQEGRTASGSPKDYHLCQGLGLGAEMATFGKNWMMASPNFDGKNGWKSAHIQQAVTSGAKHFSFFLAFFFWGKILTEKWSAHISMKLEITKFIHAFKTNMVTLGFPR